MVVALRNVVNYQNLPTGLSPGVAASGREVRGATWDAPWLACFMNELLAFPNGRHDDQVDSVSQFLKWEWNRRRRGRIATVPPVIIYQDY